MEHKIYSIRDSKGELYGRPFYKNTHGEAEREFNTLTNDAKSVLNQFPEDFDLFYLGTYDDASGRILGLETPQHIIKAIQLKKSV